MSLQNTPFVTGIHISSGVQFVMKLPVVALASLMIMMQSCAFDRPLATQAVDFNRSLELAGNEMILLNVVRSMNYMPMYFSNISSVNTTVSSSLSSTLGVEIPIPFNGSDDNVSVMPSVMGETTGGIATATMNSLEVDNFIQGMLGPLDPTYIKLFEEQGWPEKFLLTMIVRKLRIDSRVFDYLKRKIPALPVPACCGPGGNQLCSEDDVEDGGEGEHVRRTYVVYYNRPDQDFCELDTFVDFLEFVADFDFKEVSSDKAFGEPFKVSGNAELAELTLKAKKENLKLKSLGGGKYEFTEKKSTWQTELALRPKESGAGVVPLKGLISEEGQVEPDYEYGGVDIGHSSKAKPIQFYLKTPQQMLFYLGRILEVQLANGNSYDHLAKTYWEYNQRKPLFVVTEYADEPDDQAVRVEYGGKWYSIRPGGTFDREDLSISTLSFVKQVIGLNTFQQNQSGTGVFTGVVVP